MSIALSELLARAPEGQEPVVPFMASALGLLWRVTAVLERTSVLEHPFDKWAERKTVRHDQVVVVEEEMRFRNRPRTNIASPGEGMHHHQRRSRVPRPPDSDARRAAADRGRQTQERERLARLAREDHHIQRGPPCQRCGNAMRHDSKGGICYRCSHICPTCGGPKVDHARFCIACKLPPARRPKVIRTGRPCARCGKNLHGNSHRDTCIACRRICPKCGSRKHDRAEWCRTCRPPQAAAHAGNIAQQAKRKLTDLPTLGTGHQYRPTVPAEAFQQQSQQPKEHQCKPDSPRS